MSALVSATAIGWTLAGCLTPIPTSKASHCTGAASLLSRACTLSAYRGSRHEAHRSFLALGPTPKESSPTWPRELTHETLRNTKALVDASIGQSGRRLADRDQAPAHMLLAGSSTRALC